MGNEVRIKASVTGNAKQEIGSIRGAWDRFQKEGSVGVKAGLTAAAAAKGFSLLDTAISGVVGVMGDAVSAAIEDQASIQKLGTSLKANIANWDGNTAAIEKTLEARMKLGFSDDEQRDSLAKLVAATHDVNKALDIQRTAMDLARFKGISLADATDALTKVEAGQYRMLKSLGIVLKDGATQQDALNAVQAVANGQAEEYANTTGGKLLVAQTKANEALEKLGYTILPAVAEALDAVAKGLDPLSVSFRETEEAASRGSQAAIARLGQVKDATSAMVEGAQQAESRFGGVSDDFSKDFDGIGRSAKDTADAVQTAVDDMVSALETAQGDLEKAASDVAHSLFDPIMERRKLNELDSQRKQAQAVLDAKSTGKKERAEAQLTLSSVTADTLEVLAKMAEAGDAEAAARLTAFVASAKASKTLSAQQISYLDGLLAKIAAVKAAAARLAGMNLAKIIEGSGHTEHRAGGGPLMPGGKYIVGENGPERVIMGPSGGGMVIPNGGGSGSPSGGGATIILNWHSMMPPTPADAERLRRYLKPILG